MTPGEASRRVKEQARRLGFDAVGIAAAGRLDRHAEALSAWLAGGYQAGMAWLGRDPGVRSEPGRLLPGCRSVVVVAMNHGPESAPPPPPGRAKVALYARGRDYHRVLGRRLRELADWIAASLAAESRAFVDTGPVLERGWAERAGVGWIGKNATLITRDQGSWLLLGEVLTAAELEPDPGPHLDHCGSCTACLDACPTSAFVAPGVLDATRCISYWTIEHRGPLPIERRAGIGDWIFGCDDCQTCCPWNESFARPPRENPLGRRDDLEGLDPEAILRADEGAFRARYSGTALMRAKWEGMRRNACVVLGNRGDRRAVEALVAALGDPADPVVRGHAAWALGRIGGARAAQALAARAASETDAAVQREIATARAAAGDAA